MATSDPLLQLVAAAVVLAVPLGCFIVKPSNSTRWGLGPAAAGATGAAGSFAVSFFFLNSRDIPAAVLDGAVAGAIAASLAIVAAERLGVMGGAVFAALWSLVVFQPVFVATIGPLPQLVQTVFGAVDFSAVLATHVAPAASMIALSLVSSAGVLTTAHDRFDVRRAALGLALVTLGATAWMIGAERVLSDATGRILGNALVGLLLGAVVWSLIERIAGRPFTPRGLVFGAVVAWGAIGLGVPFLSPMALGATAVIAVAAGAAGVVRASAHRIADRRIAVGIIVAVAVGGVLLALLADGFGLAATGSTALVAGQLGAVLSIGLGSFIVGFLCGGVAVLAVGLANRRARSRPATARNGE